MGTLTSQRELCWVGESKDSGPHQKNLKRGWWGIQQDLNRNNLFCDKVNANLSLCFTNYALRHEDVWETRCIDPALAGDE
jgi:hypothetical protein